MKSPSEEDSSYFDFPLGNSSARTRENVTQGIPDDEVTFSGKRQSYCVCYIDMINSTTITAGMSEFDIGKYYSIFLNSMAVIAKNFGAKIIKNAGDSLIFYFPRSLDSVNILVFKDILECFLTMSLAHDAINAKLSKEDLPAMNYRISADFGQLEVAWSTTANSSDFFGSTMNVCAKINSKAMPNGIVIGSGLYEKIKNHFNNDAYKFEEIGTYPSGAKENYPIYSVTSKEKRIMLNPFARTASQNPQDIAIDDNS